MLATLILIFSIVLPQPNTPYKMYIQDINHQDVYATYTDLNQTCHSIVFTSFDESHIIQEDFYDISDDGSIMVDFEQDEYGHYNDILWYHGVDFALQDLGNC